MRSEVFYVNEKSTDTSWDRTSNLPIFSTAVEWGVGVKIRNIVLLSCSKLLHSYLYIAIQSLPAASILKQFMEQSVFEHLVIRVYISPLE